MSVTAESPPPVFRMNGERLTGFDHSKVVPFDFQNPDFLSQADLRQLGAMNTRFVQRLSARLSTFLRMECGLKTTEFTSIPFAKFCESMASPSHIALFQIEPLRGVGLVEIRIPLGLTMSDRLLGGKGRLTGGERTLSEIETALLDDVVQLMLQEWVRLWESDEPPLVPQGIGHETGGRFLQTSAPDAMFVVSTIEVSLGEITETVQLGTPFAMIEPLLKKLDRPAARHDALPKKMQWRTPFAGISVPVSAEWQLREMTLREVMGISEGQVLELSRDLVAETRVRFSNTEEFLGTVGVQNGQVAVQLTQRIAKN